VNADSVAAAVAIPDRRAAARPDATAAATDGLQVASVRAPQRRAGREEPMAYWLVKSEPDAWSWDQQVASGAKGEAWTGVRNHTAKLNLQKMKKGVRAFFYHSNVGKEIVGIVEVVREAYPDPTAKPGDPWVVVDFKAVAPLPKPISLEAIKQVAALKDMALIKFSRLSVQPVTDKEWATVTKLAGMK
jgi:predicted RNA-binding protein with PUA-like domain